MKQNSYADADDFWQPPSDSARKWFADQREAAKAPPAPPPMSAVTRDRLAALDAREGFLRPPGSFPISPTLAKQLHYHPRAAGSPGAPPVDDLDAELRSLEEMVRR